MSDKSRKSARDTLFAINIAYIAAGILIIILSVIAFISPEEHLIFFPLIFMLAAVLNFMNFYVAINSGVRDSGKRIGAAFSLMAGAALIIAAAAAMLSI